MRLTILFIFLPTLLFSQEVDSTKVSRSLEQALKNPQEVFHLDLKGQRLESIPAEVFQFSELKSLVLKRNLLE